MRTKRQLEKWIEVGVSYGRSLPPKQPTPQRETSSHKCRVLPMSSVSDQRLNRWAMTTPQGRKRLVSEWRFPTLHVDRMVKQHGCLGRASQ